jgi:sorting nexin-1/2
MHAKVSDAVLGKDKLVERSEYEKLKHYVLELEDHLAEVRQQSMKLVKQQQELGQVLSGFGKSVKLLGNCEGGSLGKAFADLGDCSDELSSKLQSQVRFSNCQILLASGTG